MLSHLCGCSFQTKYITISDAPIFNNQTILLEEATQDKVGYAVLNTVPKDLSSAVNAIFAVTGNVTLETSAQTLGESINEINAEVTSIVDYLGDAQIAPTIPLTLKSCTFDGSEYALGTDIYTTSNIVSDTINKIIACAKWDALIIDHYLTPTGLVGDCSEFLFPGQANSECLKYLGV